MATFEINEKLLRKYVKELIAMDEDFNVDVNQVNEKIEDYLAGLEESPEEIIASSIVDDLYYDSMDEEEEEQDIEDEK